MGRASKQPRAAFVEQLCHPLQQANSPEGSVVLFYDEAHIGTDTEPGYSPDLQPVERLWAWLREDLQALHCHKDLAELEARIACIEAARNDCPSAVHARLRSKLHLIVPFRREGQPETSVAVRSHAVAALP